MSTLLVIESAMAGLVIGRGGATIKTIQQDSGAMVKLTNGDTADTRNVKIIGSEDAQRLASGMIEKIVGKLLRSETITTPPPPPRRQARGGGTSRGTDRPRPKRRSVSPVEKITISDEAWEEILRENRQRDLEIIQSLPPIIKDLYVEHKQVKAMSDEEVQSFRTAQNDTTVQYVDGAECLRPIPKPIKTFEHAFGSYPDIMKVIKKQNFTVPSPIQCQAWPIIMSGHDLIAIAQTGSGKTLAYILPAIIHLLGQPTPRNKRIGPSVMIMGPTRELVLQIHDEITKYLYNNIKVVCVYGGGVSAQEHQKLIKAEKPDIVVATPGRLNDLIGIQAIKLEHVSYLVLDEADRMLDMGFKNQIELSLRHVRPDKQTILTSATWPTAVKNLANYFTKNPLHITVGSLDLSTVNTVTQKIIILKEHQKEAWLDEFISTSLSKDDKVIIFMRKKTSVEKMYENFIRKNIKCRCLHGGRLQINRERSLADMRKGVVSILIATDVASRGIDIHDITVVINYDFPTNIEEYVHRVGRTGRAGKTGSAYTLFSDYDKFNASSLISVLKKSNQPIPAELYKMTTQ
ncbi:probable ATP-dependent RNA helicase DDX43 [Rhopalosiphum maidis]|uniref:probable ATP-dependent RNA helicase DDX43 n=1 Tax=Rhopalosiphum maidis TaxID=43146 RepID=UPI000EFF1FAC|nr:probable ATP-dependent RNA helicase DDX43 [Rhopalosiphum maidis]